MTFKHDGKYFNYEKVTDETVNYNSDIQTVYVKCLDLSKKYGVPLSEFELSAGEQYGCGYWEITFVRPATPKEESLSRREEELRLEYGREIERKQYEILKKKFENKSEGKN